MLDILFGSKSVEKVLMFLFVNERCYGAELQRLLQVPLTPIQKALSRLEKGGVVTSSYEGKTRIYRFNATYPFLEELESLLKRAYTNLSPQEKKSYCLAKESMQKGGRSGANTLLRTMWGRLSEVRSLAFCAKSRSRNEGGWDGRGKGQVIVTQDAKNVLTFREKGAWVDKNGQGTDFSNAFRWTLDREIGVISLEHLRHGVEHPVFLFHLAPAGEYSMASVDSHLCDGDSYFGQLLMEPHALRLHWRVIGPKKNEEMDYYYYTTST